MIVSYNMFVVGLGLKYCGNKKACSEKPPALQFAGAEIFREPPELCFVALATLDAAFEIKLVI